MLQSLAQSVLQAHPQAATTSRRAALANSKIQKSRASASMTRKCILSRSNANGLTVRKERSAAHRRGSYTHRIKIAGTCSFNPAGRPAHPLTIDSPSPRACLPAAPTLGCSCLHSAPLTNLVGLRRNSLSIHEYPLLRSILCSECAVSVL